VKSSICKGEYERGEYMELTKAQKDAEKTIRIIMFEEVIGTSECEYAYTQITDLIEEHDLQGHDKLLNDVYDNFVEFECHETAALFAKKFNLSQRGNND
jgi:hypothetical protein